MSYKQQSPLPVVEGGTGTELFEMAVGKQGYGVILCGQFSTNPLEVIQDPGTAGQVLTSNGVGERPTFQSVSGDGAVIEITPDTGGAILPSSGNINLVAGVASHHSGSSVSFSGTGNTITLNVTDSNINTIIGQSSGNFSMTGENNVALGARIYTLITSGAGNIAIGDNSCQSLLTGENNITMGFGAGNNYTGAESSNILLNSVGLTGESNVLRIGNATGTGPGELNGVAICGIAGANVGSVATVVTEANDQLGTAVITAGSGITITPGANIITITASGTVPLGFNADSGTAAPSANVIHINSGNSSQVCGSSVEFIGSGSTVQLHVTDAMNNTIIGSGAGNGSHTGTYNVSLGIGTASHFTTGSFNVLLGSLAGENITTGSDNTIIGTNAGSAYTSSESSNILIGEGILGTALESNVLRIGNGTGTGTGQINKSFISGIRGITTGNADAVAVVVDSAGQLGTVSSSRRFKNNIQDMNDASSAIFDLRPVTFAYNSDSSGKTQYGLIAEEVEAIFPDIVVRNKDGEIETVQYHILPVLLLNEIKKLNALNASLNARITALETQ